MAGYTVLGGVILCVCGKGGGVGGGGGYSAIEGCRKQLSSAQVIDCQRVYYILWLFLFFFMIKFYIVL